MSLLRHSRPMLSDRCLSDMSCPVYDVGVLWPNGWMDQGATWQGGRSRPKRHCVTWRPSSLTPKGGRTHNLRPRPMSIVAKRLDA